MKTLYIRLENFKKDNNDLGSRCYTSEPINNNLAHIIGDYCKAQGIDYNDCGMMIFEREKDWMNDYENWHSNCHKGNPNLVYNDSNN